jgi:hypothetical protein
MLGIHFFNKNDGRERTVTAIIWKRDPPHRSNEKSTTASFEINKLSWINTQNQEAKLEKDVNGRGR